MFKVKLVGGTILAVLLGAGITRITYSMIQGAPVNVMDCGSKGDGVTDDSIAVSNCRAKAQTQKRSLYFPAGTYLVDATAMDYGNVVGNTNASNIVILGEGEQRSILKAKNSGETLLHVAIVTSGETQGFEIGRLGFQGHGAADVGVGHGIFVEGNASHLYFHDLRILGFSGHAMLLSPQWHTLIEDVTGGDTALDIFDISGGNTTTVIRSYALTVAAGMAGWRIRAGRVTMIGVNGINNIWGATNANTGLSEDQADWGVFGSAIATAWAPLTAYSLGAIRSNGGEEYEVITAGTSAGAGGPAVISKDTTDGTAHWRHIGHADVAAGFFRGTLIGCNIEDPTRTGIRLKDNSSLNLISTSFIPPPGAPAASPGLIALWTQNQSATVGPTFIDGNSFTETTFSQYDHASPIHNSVSASSAILQFGGTGRTLPGWARVNQLAFNNPSITVGTCGQTGGTKLYNCVVSPGLSLTGAFQGKRIAPTFVSGGTTLIDPTLGQMFDISVTDGVAFSIGQPGNGGTDFGVGDGMRIHICIINTTAGVLGAVTWPAKYHMSTATTWVQPAAGKRACIDFQNNGTSWYETSRSLSDVAN